MANGTEGSFWGAEQMPQAEVAPQASEAKQRFAALRDRAIEGAKEGFVGSVESGKAEKVADRAIDVAAKAAEASLNALPPGTRMVGKFVGRRLIGRLQEAAHDKVGSTLDQAADRMVAPVSPNYSPPAIESSGFGINSAPIAPESGGWGAAPAPAASPIESRGWGAPPPAAEPGNAGFGGNYTPTPETAGWGGAPVPTAETASSFAAAASRTPETSGWGGTPPTTEIGNTGFGSTPETSGWGGAPPPTSTETAWWTDPNAQPAVEIPPAKKESLFKRLKGSSSADTAAPSPTAAEVYAWATPPAPDSAAGKAWW